MRFTAAHDGNGLTRVLLANVVDPGASIAVRAAAATALGAMLPIPGAEAPDGLQPLPQARLLHALSMPHCCSSSSS